MQPSNNTALVLEGGAMRGVFTCGVLDWLMDNKLHFPYVVGVSAGACNGASYVSRQRGRARYSNIELFEKYRYAGFRHYLTKGNMLDFDLLFHEFPYHILPFDFDSYAASGIEFEIAISNCLTGEVEYKQEYTDHDRLLDILKASSSMPLFSPVTYVDGIPMLDGGICDSIPAERALSKGYNRLIIVLTRNKGYRKDETSIQIPSFLFRKYPHIREAINRRNKIYNSQLEYVDQLEEDGRATVIRPTEAITIRRLEKNIEKLIYFYDHGYECADRILGNQML